MTGAYGGRQFTQAEVGDPSRQGVLDRSVQQAFTRLTTGHKLLYHLVHVPSGTAGIRR